MQVCTTPSFGIEGTHGWAVRMQLRHSAARLRSVTLLVVLLCWFAHGAHAELLDNLNQLRLKGCEQSSSELPRLRRSTGLDLVAGEWSKGGRLAEALQRSRYRTNKSASMQVQGEQRDAKIALLLRESYCYILTDARYSEVGLFRRDSAVWIVVAMPFTVPTESDAPAIQRRILQLVNEARSQPRKCGATEFGAATPLQASPELVNAALEHSRDMLTQNYFKHAGSDGSTPATRVTSAGYVWSSVAENIAAGMATPEQVVQGWLDSPGHCFNIMQATLTDMGVAYASDPDSEYGIYWTQVLAQPRSVPNTTGKPRRSN